jgi:hypothetical protein
VLKAETHDRLAHALLSVSVFFFTLRDEYDGAEHCDSCCREESGIQYFEECVKKGVIMSETLMRRKVSKF